MTDTTIFDERNIMLTIARILGHSKPTTPVPHMACTWIRNPGNGRLECHWLSQIGEH